jgi:hypothetical protein
VEVQENALLYMLHCPLLDSQRILKFAFEKIVLLSQANLQRYLPRDREYSNEPNVIFYDKRQLTRMFDQ